MLKSLQNIINHSMEGAQGRFDAFMSSMRSSYDIVSSNRKELSGKVCAACGEAGCPHAAACALAANEAADPEKPGVEEAADQ